MNLTPEEKEVGKENYFDAVAAENKAKNRAEGREDVDDVTRRDFLRGVVAAGAVSGVGLGAMYFGYGKPEKPVRIGMIGTGDEGGILIGALNPDFVEVVAIADIRPSSVHRAFHGDYGGSNAMTTHALRPGLMQKYGWTSEGEARNHVKVYEDYQDLLGNSDVEAVIIALPLHLHCRATIDAMNKGKHVLTEKLMAHNIAQCKIMAEASYETGKLLATGHQRHYSVLYDNAVHLIKWGLLGQIHHIRAQWHRGNLPGNDSWAPPIPGGKLGHGDKVMDKIKDDLEAFKAKAAKEKDPANADILQKRIKQWAAWNDDQNVNATAYGYKDIELGGYTGSAIEELVRWRLWERTGGGLMAELGSHQLDAASIFISALSEDGSKPPPLTVHGVGGRHVFPLDRDADDHVYCMFEFPGPEYSQKFDFGYRDPVLDYPNPSKGIPDFDSDTNKKIVVTYSSINGNPYGGYGEVVMGTKGSLVLEREKEIMLYKSGVSPSTRVGVKTDGGPTLDTQESGGGAVAKAAAPKNVSRGYAEEIEHWAWCIRNPSPENMPRCKPEVALYDACLALTAKEAIRKANAGQGGFIEFQKEWFDYKADGTPDGSKKSEELDRLKQSL